MATLIIIFVSFIISISTLYVFPFAIFALAIFVLGTFIILSLLLYGRLEGYSKPLFKDSVWNPSRSNKLPCCCREFGQIPL